MRNYKFTCCSLFSPQPIRCVTLGYVFKWIPVLSFGGSGADNVSTELLPLTVHCSSPGG